MIMSKKCFNLREWEDNVPLKCASKYSSDISVAGILWNQNNDILLCIIELNELTCNSKIIQRTVFSNVQAIFDHAGLIVPTT